MERSRDAGYDDAGRAVQLAELALEIGRRVDPDEYGARLVADLEARAWMVLANARRIASDLSGSERAFRIAHSLLAEGTGDPLEEARLLSMKAVLRSDQRRFPEAGGFLEQAIGIYRRTGQRRSLGQTLIRKGTALGEAGEAADAIKFLREGVQLLDLEQDRRWVLVGKHNMVLYLSELGEVREALQLLEETRPLYAQLGESLNLVRLRWLEGRLALAQGRVAEAEGALCQVREAFIERAMGFDAALATLDLATVYLTRGRTGEIKQLTAEMVPIFEALGTFREAIAALVVFRQAVEAEQVTLRLIQDVSGFLEKSRHDPRLRFSQSAAS
jgi:tetratricopeptide (TPR) repeat protein